MKTNEIIQEYRELADVEVMTPAVQRILDADSAGEWSEAMTGEEFDKFIESLFKNGN